MEDLIPSGNAKSPGSHIDSNFRRKALLLRLPCDIRQKIYTIAGLITKRDTISLHFHDSHPWSSEPPGEWSSKDQSLIKCSRPYHLHIPNQLFYTSRDISNDALSIFYSENAFEMQDYRGLPVLQSLSPRALRAIKSLYLSIQASRCPYGLLYGDHPSDATCEISYEWPFKNNIYPCQNLVLSEWNQALSHLASHLQPDRLDLRIQLNTLDEVFVAAMVKPLAKLSTLKHCSIDCEAGAHPVLQRLAEIAVLHTTGKAEGTPFRLLNLPLEIQLRILEHTELIAPSTIIRIEKTGYTSEHCYSPFANCNAYHSMIHCRLDRVAYSSRYEASCWKYPTSMFSVNKHIRALSRQIFFSRNKFYLEPYSSEALVGPRTNISQLPPDCWQNLRYLHFLFPTLKETHHLPSQTETASWLRLLDLIVDHIPLPQLTIVINMANERLSTCWDYVPPPVDDAQQERNMWAVYVRVISPITQLEERPKDLFIHIDWPLVREKDALRDHRERLLEKMVMGDEYDSFSRGKVPLRDFRGWF
ncbi:hypothetical protein AJ80_06229 [Polytolypa hystricis UAMH7299]|uniref:F-box domain-containing protein n=1 Tax=Polytolypa hystricis (strain UAMH7299) TaxID=1447883 RepID=A0A2B7XPK0_POLH7|nr:hypothetical protein AJ80_06229 [Polytolypa hystricis UAMH7299]